MDNIVISGVRPYDGRYEFDIEAQPLSTREWGWIKRHAGYLPGNIEDGLSDPELIVVFAVIALRRAAKIDDREVPEVFDRLADAPFGSTVTYEPDPVGEEEAEPGPPSPSSNSSSNSSGPDSSKSSETSDGTQTASGTPDSATSEFEHLRSVS